MTTTPQSPDPTQTPQTPQTSQSRQSQQTLKALRDNNSSVRLRAALAAGTSPDPRYVDHLVERSATEPEFFVRDMLTWALTRHPVDLTLPELLGELSSEHAQARSQALHTLSKIADPRSWPAITKALLTDADDEVARSAWRAAVLLVPEGDEAALAATLATQLGRGERETQLSLSQALVALGAVIEPVLHEATTAPNADVRAHALATRQLLHDPDAGFTLAIEEAKRTAALTGAPQNGQEAPGAAQDTQGTPRDGQ
ncbi:hypothetical protein DEJ49_00040 [Streptomyces venezuelae]|uniref:HEAT repeat domain-containing protein n=1 Tax=Streptomyces venezuelae TaxID=54571 RepID=A0A5P2CAH6_STRVZ|nr:HEAT repeat domain-containing protein [Streptomyces venezuelae]QES39573.1 hypothetical protein DEJ49_00040 [Streptomyces venezuelae]